MKRLTYLAVVLALLVAVVLSPALSAKAQDGGNVLCNGLAEADCATLNSSAAAMEGITSFSAPSWTISAVVPAEKGTSTFNASGSAHFAGLGGDGSDLLVHLVIDEASVSGPDGDQSGSLELLVLGNMLYVKSEGQWYGGDMTETDTESVQGLGDLGDLGSMGEMDLNPSGLDMSTLITTVPGAETTVGGATAIPYTTSIDVTALLMTILASPVGQQITDMAGSMIASGEGGMQMQGLTPELLMGFVPFLAPMFQGTSISFEQSIGVDDNLVHGIKVDIVFNFDTSQMAAMMGGMTGQAGQAGQQTDMQPIKLEFHFFSEMAEHNGSFEVEAPSEYMPLEELDLEMNMDLGAAGKLLESGTARGK